MKILIKFLTWTIVFYLIYYVGFINPFKLNAYDIFFVYILIVSLATAITFSNSYGLYEFEKAAKDKSKTDENYKMLYLGIKRYATHIHAYYCWKIVYYLLMILPLYCTCVVIYISAYSVADSMSRILIYSILSLVLSLAIYVIDPKTYADKNKSASAFIYEKIAPILLNRCNETAYNELMAILTKTEIDTE